MGIKTRRGIEFGYGVSIEYDAGSGELKFKKGATEQLGLSGTETIITADANGNQGPAKITELHIGTSGSETQITATATEINKLTGAGAALASGTQAANITDASTAHALNATFSDTEVEAALNALGTKINAIIDALEAFGISASA